MILYMLFGIDFHHNFSPDKSRALASYGVRRESERLIARSLSAAVGLCEMSAAGTLADHLAHELGCGSHCGWGTHCRVPHSGRVASGISIDCMGTPPYLWLGPEAAKAAGTNTHSLPALSARVLTRDLRHSLHALRPTFVMQFRSFYNCKIPKASESTA